MTFLSNKTLWRALLTPIFCFIFAASPGAAQDFMREMQRDAVESGTATWGHWGVSSKTYSKWTNHSNRLIPVYTFGIDLKNFKDQKSLYRNEDSIKKLYGDLPQKTVNLKADYFDQTDLYHLQKAAIESGKKYVFLVIFDGMDWQTTQATAIYKSGKVTYRSGRGTGLHFQDYKNKNATTDFGWMVASPHNTSTKFDVNSQVVTVQGRKVSGGYSAQLGGATPWATGKSDSYLLGKYRRCPHAVTDSAASATSMTAGIKTYNGSINVAPDGTQVEPIGRWLQRTKGYSIGVVTSVPISHATPACAYANNVNRNDYQDLSRDLLGLPAISHRDAALSGIDVLLGGGFGEKETANVKQGSNFLPGNKYIANDDFAAVNVKNGGKYAVAVRTKGEKGIDVLTAATDQAVTKNLRLFGLFGTKGGHLPYQTADGDYNPTRGVKTADSYKSEDIRENPTLAELTTAALRVLEKNDAGFWMMVEAGDVDWANHNNNLDDSIGAVLSGDAAVKSITDWIEKHDAWKDSAVIVTADHGHFLVVSDLDALHAPNKKQAPLSAAQ